MQLFAAPVPAGKKALEHETAYRLLAYAVQEVYGLPLPEIACDSRGKPFFTQRQEICFNLSHCRGLAVCGISAFPLGVDCESIRSLREGVLRRSFAPEEVLAVMESPQPDETFFRFWTLKEAFVKALGVGISYPLHTAVFALDGEDVTRHPQGWQFRQFRPDSGHVVSCCGASEDTLPEELHVVSF